MIYEVTIDDKTYRVDLVHAGAGWKCILDGREFPVDVVATQQGTLSLLVDGKSYEVRREDLADGSRMVVGSKRFHVQVHDPRSLRSRRSRDTGAQGARKIVAPMPGKVVRILAEVGAEVESGQAVLVIEAMKMQNELKAPKKGKITKLNVGPGDAVEAGQALAEVE